MTPYQIAREECCNHEPNGNCIGIDVAPVRALGVNGKCVIPKGDRCQFFEEAVLHPESYKKGDYMHKRMSEAKLAYVASTGATLMSGKRSFSL